MVVTWRRNISHASAKSKPNQAVSINQSSHAGGGEGSAEILAGVPKLPRAWRVPLSLSLSLYICVEGFLVVNGEEAGNSKSLFSLLPCFCLLLLSCILWLRVDWCHVNSTKCVSRAIICDGNVGFVAETRVDAAHRMFQLQRRINRFCSTTTA